MINYNSITLSPITEEAFNQIYDILKQDDLAKKYVFFNYEDAHGIFYEKRLVGLFKLSSFIGNSLSISIAILNEYRGKGIAQIARMKIVELYGKEYPDVKLFISNTIPNNKSSNKSLQNLGWQQTHEYDEIMIDEGAEFFNIYFKENPYYEKKESLKQ